MDFYFSPLDYLEEGALRFVDITNNPDLTIEPMDNGQPITDSEDEKVRKQNKRTARRKTELNNLRAAVRDPAPGFTALLSSYPGSLTCWLPLPARPGTPTALLSRLVRVPVPGSPAVLLPLPVLGPTPPHLASTAFRTFKQALSDEFLRCSASFAESLCLFPLLGLLPNKTDCKWTFNTVFINSVLLAGNHT